ncbi:SCO family protein [Pedobacter punctiformis]|uniref:SCO family protein n=1 Tax=Pedobacter punctiformis TaxID=3004097 RepID=A0ABT4LBD1_9SPHI|nr:SCO family protein [Pedobacter sp. HCMS5-2]MCZ4245217.1 SCO family protein [Pedobacter sp. HCMS5-2]
MKRSPIKKTLILVSILAIPGFLFFYLLPHFAKNRYKSLPIYGDKIVASTFHTVKGKKIPDTIYHVVPDFKLVNQNNDSISWKSLNQKIVVLNLFYTTTTVKEVSDNIKKTVENYERNPLIRFVSISVDPGDDVAKLKSYAASLKARHGKWDLLKGDTTELYPLIRKGLRLDVIAHQEAGANKFIYGNQILLLDNQHRIRGYYEATNPDALAKLDDEIKVLVAEDLRNIKDGR